MTKKQMETAKDGFPYYIGIDEAGRGPIAGPVYLGAVLAKKRFFLKPFFLDAVYDSKKLTSQKRRRIYELLKEESIKGNIKFTYGYVGAQIIDKDGIQKSIQVAINRCLKRICKNPQNTMVLLDGGLRAPQKFINQETIIKGDEKETLIALASIVAKVLRDEMMENYSVKYPEFLFHEHKGYGTKLHYKKLKKHGPSILHRLSFL